VGIPIIERAKIQAQVLVPLVKALQAELGEERANALVRKALGDIHRRLRGLRLRHKAHAHTNHHARRELLRFSLQATTKLTGFKQLHAEKQPLFALSFYATKDGKISVSYQGWDASKTVLKGQQFVISWGPQG
jgi:hypothetical protein